MADDFAEFEDRQEHTNHHAANDDAEEHDQDGFDHRGQSRQDGFDFFVEEIRNAFEHVIDFAGLFTGGDHADDHARKNGVLGQRGGNALAAFDIRSRDLDGFFHHDVADGLRNDLKHFQNRHTAADQRSQGAGEARQTNFMRDAAENGQFDAAGIPEFPSCRGFDEMNPASYGAAACDDEIENIALDEIADIDQALGRCRKLGSEA